MDQAERIEYRPDGIASTIGIDARPCEIEHARHFSFHELTFIGRIADWNGDVVDEPRYRLVWRRPQDAASSLNELTRITAACQEMSFAGARHVYALIERSHRNDGRYFPGRECIEQRCPLRPGFLSREWARDVAGRP
jgi:hypothetical protein